MCTEKLCQTRSNYNIYTIWRHLFDFWSLYVHVIGEKLLQSLHFIHLWCLTHPWSHFVIIVCDFDEYRRSNITDKACKNLTEKQLVAFGVKEVKGQRLTGIVLVLKKNHTSCGYTAVLSNTCNFACRDLFCLFSHSLYAAKFTIFTGHHFIWLNSSFFKLYFYWYFQGKCVGWHGQHSTSKYIVYLIDNCSPVFLCWTVCLQTFTHQPKVCLSGI